MKLTAEQQTHFENWLRQKIEHSSCTLCQANRWKIGDLISGQVGDGVEETAPGARMIQLICKNCGHVLLFDTRYITNWDSQHSTDVSHSGLIM
ncbi:MAG TPA: hypothetical protein VHZ24_17635 [Pirellulales bacterium]|jgi:hypothetical protein|nr:hypothetical protein [Pirellulales bacterium]